MIYRLLSLLAHFALGAKIFELSTRRRKTIFTLPAQVLACCIATAEIAGTLEAISERPIWRRAARLSHVAHNSAIVLMLGTLVLRSKEIIGAPAAHVDRLTKIPNLVAFNEELVKDLSGDTRHVAIVVVDLDGFKVINDRHGHLVGDVVLVEVARRLRTLLAVPSRVYRIGGDEFAAIVVDRPAIDLEHVAASIRQAIERPIQTSLEDPFVVGASVGFAHRVHSERATSLFERADIAMYADKRSRKS